MSKRLVSDQEPLYTDCLIDDTQGECLFSETLKQDILKFVSGDMLFEGGMIFELTFAMATFRQFCRCRIYHCRGTWSMDLFHCLLVL